MQEPKFAVVIPSYNNKNWYEKNLDSVIAQKYENFRVIYTDDCSPDGTGDLVEEYLGKRDSEINSVLFHNGKRKGAMENMYDMVHMCDDDEIIVVLDGDDWFAHDGVLDRLAEEYRKPNVWMTYGQFIEHPSEAIGCSRQIPDHIKQNGSYRKFRWCSSHLRTYYAWLFKRIKKEDLMLNGEFFSMSSDLAAMFPMLEMSGMNHSFISDILYVYNCETPLNDSKVNIKNQQSLEFYIRAQKPYQKINL